MPKTKFQDFIFTIIMVIVMVYAMVCYNIAFDKGVGNDIFLLALHELPIMGVIGFLLEFFAVGKLAQKITFKHFDPKSTNPFLSLLWFQVLRLLLCARLWALLQAFFSVFRTPHILFLIFVEFVFAIFLWHFAGSFSTQVRSFASYSAWFSKSN